MVKRDKAFVAVMGAYTVLVIVTIATLIRGIVMGSMKDVLFSTIVLLEFTAVYLVLRRSKLHFPAALEIFIIIYLFASQILAQVFELMRIIACWDIILHTTAGFLLAVLGVFLISFFIRNAELRSKLPSVFILLFVFSFSMMTAVIWEFSEYSLDKVLKTDMQKDTIVDTVISEMLNPNNDKPAMRVEDITETVIYGTVNGEETAVSVDGYLDIGFLDTLEDMFVHFCGTVVFIVIFGLELRKGGGRFTRGFIPRVLTEEEALELSHAR